eukprot:SAG31_NODE_3198_length_4565_cov_4.748097_6_plen_52_part_00
MKLQRKSETLTITVFDLGPKSTFRIGESLEDIDGQVSPIPPMRCEEPKKTR